MICVIPGLIWPNANASEMLKCAPLPGLAGLLGCAQTTHHPSQSLEDWLLEQFNLKKNPPLAPIRLTGESSFLCDDTPPLLPSERTYDRWLCADPVSLTLADTQAVLSGPDQLDIQVEEAEALIAGLNETFFELGHFYAATPTRWYLNTRAELGVSCHSLANVIGRPISLFPIEGENQSFWTVANNEIQVFCHNHPVNQAREAAGKPPINSLWFWGTARNNSKEARFPIGSHVASLKPIAPLLAGFAKMANVQLHALGEKPHEHDWALVDSLVNAASERDPLNWVMTMRQVDILFFQPLWEAMRQGKLKELKIIAPCDHTLDVISVKAPSWLEQRRKKPLSADLLAAFLTTQPRHAVIE